MSENKEEFVFCTHEFDIPPSDMRYMIDTAKKNLRNLEEECQKKLERARKRLHNYERGSRYRTSRVRAGIYS